MGELNKIMTENQELRRLLEEVIKERNKYRSQALMRANKIEQLQKQIDEVHQ
jgi:archaellum component FlaC